MSDFVLTRYESGLASTWDDVVKSSKNGNFLHLRAYMDYHAHRFDEQSVIVRKRDKPVAVFPSNRVDDKIVSHGGLTYGGLIYGNDLHAVEVLGILALLATHYKEQGAATLKYKAIPHVFHRYPAEEDLYALFRLGARIYRRDLSAVIPIPERIRLSDSRKNTIRKATKHGVVVREEQHLADFHRLLETVLARMDLHPVHTLAELGLLKSRFPDQIRLFGAFQEDRMLAGTLVFDFGHVAHTQYMASSDEGRSVGALDLALAYLLENAFPSHRHLSFGVSTEQDGKYLNEGLAFQKEGFGGRGLVHDFYELEL